MKAGASPMTLVTTRKCPPTKSRAGRLGEGDGHGSRCCSTRPARPSKLPDADKGDIDTAKAIALMVANPSVIKRPVVTGASALLVGFKPDQWEAVFPG